MIKQILTFFLVLSCLCANLGCQNLLRGQASSIRRPGGLCLCCDPLPRPRPNPFPTPNFPSQFSFTPTTFPDFTRQTESLPTTPNRRAVNHINLSSNIVDDILTQCEIRIGSVCRRCSEIPNCNGQRLSASSCQCNTGYIWRDNGCRRDCSKVLNSNGAVEFSDSCQCRQGYVWRDGACKRNGIDCSNIGYNDGQLSDWSCRCKQGYTWKSKTSSCNRIQGWVNCSSIAYSTGRVTDFACLCNSNYTWDGKICMQKQTIQVVRDCSRDPYSTGQSEFQQIMKVRTCKCNEGFIWSYTQSICSTFTQMKTFNGPRL